MRQGRCWRSISTAIIFETLARIDANKHGIGVLASYFYQNNADKLKVATVSGIVPSGETIAGQHLSGIAAAELLGVKKALISALPFRA